MEIFIQVIGVILVARIAYSFGYEKGNQKGKVEMYNRMSVYVEKRMSEMEEKFKDLIRTYKK